MADDLDLGKLRLDYGPVPSSVGTRLPRHKAGERFLRGPIPWAWLVLAAKQPGKALHVAVVLWLWAGIRRSSSGPLSSFRLRALGVSRFAGYRALRSLELAGLVTVERHRGRNPIVTLLPVSAPDDQMER